MEINGGLRKNAAWIWNPNHRRLSRCIYPSLRSETIWSKIHKLQATMHFARPHGDKIPTCITARASHTCRDVCRNRWPAKAGKPFPAFSAHVQPAILRIWQEAHVAHVHTAVLLWHVQMCCLKLLGLRNIHHSWTHFHRISIMQTHAVCEIYLCITTHLTLRRDYTLIAWRP